MEARKLKLAILLLALCFVLLTQANGETISVNFGFAATDINGTAGVGVFAADNWNNATGSASGSLSSLIDSTGTTTGASINWSSNEIWHRGDTPSNDDDRLMKSFLNHRPPNNDRSLNSSAPATVTFSGLPSGEYALVIYSDGDEDNINRVTVFNVNDGSGVVSKKANDAVQYPADGYVEDAGLDYRVTSDANDFGNYLLFENLSGSTLTIEFHGLDDVSWRGHLNGLQIVPAPDTEAPSVPQNLVVTATTSSSVSLSWDASTDNVGVEGYDIYRNGVYVDSTSYTSYDDTGLTANTDYSYQVSAYDAAENESALSSVVNTATDPDEMATGLISVNFGFAATDINGTAGVGFFIADNWNNATGSQSGSLASLINSNGDNTGASVSWSSNEIWHRSDTPSNDDDKLMKSFLNHRPPNNDRSLNSSSPATVTLSDLPSGDYTLVIYSDGDEDNINRVTVFNVDDGSGVVSKKANDAVQYPVDGYIEDAGLDYRITSDANDFGNYVIFENLSGTSLDIEFHGLDDISWRGHLNGIQIIYSLDLDTEPPTVPQSLTVTGTTSTSVSLSWDASTDNVGVEGYKIYRDSVVIDTVSNTSYTDTDLTASTTYSYEVSAFDAANNESDLSSTVNGTTDHDYSSDNLLLNPSFELGGANADNWANQSSNSRDTTQAHMGESSMKVTVGDTYSNQSLDLAPNTDYELSGWIKTSGINDINDDGLQIRYVEFLQAGGEIIHATDSIKGDSNWQYVRIRFTTSNDISGGRVDLRWQVSQGTGWFDDIVLRPVEGATISSPAQIIIGNYYYGAYPRKLVADGQRRTEIIARIADIDGDLVSNAQKMVTFSVSGDGILVGDNPVATQNGIARITLISPETPQVCTVTASAADLVDGIVDIQMVSPRHGDENIFPLGMFSSASYISGPGRFRDFSDDIRNRGFNSMMITNNDPDRHGRFLHISDKLGLGAYIGGAYLGDNWWYADPNQITLANAKTIVEPMVKAYANHPSFLGYYLYDEPDVNLTERLKIMADAIHELDDQHYVSPILIGDNRVEPISNESEFDTLLIDVYPCRIGYSIGDFVMANPKYDMVDYIRLVSRSHPAGVPVWIILQAHNFDAENLREPAVEEVRKMNWLALGEGVTGVFWFIYHTEQDWTGIVDNTLLYNEITDLTQRTAKIADVLLDSQKVEDRFTAVGPSDPYISTLRSIDGSEYYAVAVNENCNGQCTITIDSDIFTGKIRNLETNITYSLGTTFTFDAGDGAIFKLVPDTADTTSPSSPTNLKIDFVTDTTISLSWDAASDDQDMAGYDIYRDGIWHDWTVSASWTDTNLTAGTSYEYKVLAFDGSDNVSQFTPTITVTTSSYIDNDNLVLDGIFEHDFSGNGYPEFWNGPATDNHLTALGTIDPQESFEGTNSVKLGPAGYAYMEQPLTLQAGTKYVLRAWIKTQNVSGGNVFLRYVMLEPSISNWSTSSVNGTNAWTKVEIEFTTPADYLSGRLDIYWDFNNGNAWVDRVELYQVNLVTNNSFEAEKFHPGYPDAWTGSLNDLEIDVNNFVDGSKSLQILSGSSYAYQNINLEPNTEYELSAWIKTSQLSGDGIGIRYVQLEPVTSVWAINRLNGNSDWTQVNTTFTTPADHVSGRLDIYWDISSGNGWIDGIILTPVIHEPAEENGTISVNFGSTDVSGTAGSGIYSAGNWNNATGSASGNLSDLIDSGGTNTGIDVSWSANEIWHRSETPSDDDEKLMKSFLNHTPPNNDRSLNSTSPASVSLTNLPTGSYTLLVYSDGDETNIDRVTVFNVNDGSGVVSKTANDVVQYPVDGFLEDSGLDYRVTSNAYDYGNYIVFDNLSGSTLTIEFHGQDNVSWRGHLNGLQLIYD